VLAHRGKVPAGASGIEVDDTRIALGLLAAGWRSQFSLPLIAVTGSNGKTTVTQMIASILRAWQGDAALATQGNLNNDIGVPLTLLRLRASHRVAVIELGMNHPGEIAYLADITRANVALVNNAQREHMEFMATVEAVARENGSVLSALPAVGTAVFPADDAYTPVWAALAGGRASLRFGAPGADMQFGRVLSGCQGIGRWARKRPPGRWRSPCTSRAATTCVTRWPLRPARWRRARRWRRSAAGWRALRRSRAARVRSALQLHGRALTVVDDTYNANPDSVRAAIDVLAELPGPRLLVLGDMGEVGDQGPQFHAEAGRACARAGHRDAV
jgi:UDP-N-acetylmuramoyl-tripeptide--D-alanyl-D-alanine ligase